MQNNLMTMSAVAAVLTVGAANIALANPVAPVASLDSTAADNLYKACKATAEKTTSGFRKNPSNVVMWCSIVDREGRQVLVKATDSGEAPLPSTDTTNVLKTDAWRASINISLAKAYTALSVSANQGALDSKTVGLAARLDGPGTPGKPFIGTNKGPASLFGVGDTNPMQNLGNYNSGVWHWGIVTFAGGQPVYSCDSHKLLGAVGVSGDGVDQDDAVAKGAVTGAKFCLTP